MTRKLNDYVQGYPFFWSFNDRYEYEAWKSDLEDFFSYFSLTLRKNTTMPNLC